MKTWLVTGGAGFIGGNFVHGAIHAGNRIINLDALTYAGNLATLEDVVDHRNHVFVEGDIGDTALVQALLGEHRPEAIINFAAETHVDRSIDGPGAFVQTNVVSTLNLLENARDYFETLSDESKSKFRFLHVSTDEVYGTLGDEGKFTEQTPYAPNSPYSASKAASDHLVRAFQHTYGLPTLTTNCSNNYGPFQFPEKLIPLVILKALRGEDIPIYGDGLNVRDWLFVGDHCTAIETIIEKGVVGETYNVGGDAERTNLQVVNGICEILDELRPKQTKHSQQITFVKDRPGHDKRYAIDANKLKNELGWVPSQTFDTGLRETVEWYLANDGWVQGILDGSYQLQRIGTR